jgi:predicted dehydrogenase/threonine dehydrogenase-like Zn-dependent dehydrogenase
MKQLLQNLKTGAAMVTEVPIPTPQAGEALIHTAVSLVSAGTERMVVEFAEKSLLGKARSRPDLVRQLLDKARREGLLTTIEAAFNRLDQPMPLGYSSAGTIVALGPGVQGLTVGQRVAAAGGNYAVHAEYACVPKNLLTPLPDNVDFESAAFATLGAIALHGFRLAEPQLGERVAVIGLGLLGLLTVGIATAAGCHVLGIDLAPERVALAEKMGSGAAAVLRPQAEAAARSFSRGRGVDTALICADTASADPVELAGLIARDRGRVVAVGAVGLHIPRKIYYEKEISFVNSRSYGPGRYDPAYEEAGHDYPIGYVRWTEGRNLEAIIELLANGKLDVRPIITHRFPIERAPEAYELITGKRKEPFLGVLLTYQMPVATFQAPRVTYPSHMAHSTGKRDTVSLGVLGAGNFAAAVMLPALQKIPGIHLVGIASASGSSAAHAARKFGFRYAASDPAQIIADPGVDTVAILTRHHLHAEQAVAALQAGKHVFCEKPLALNSEQLSVIREQLLTTDHCLLMTGFNRRFAPLAVRLRQFVAERKEPLVAHYRVNAGYIPLSHWVHDPEQGGGRVIGEGCHFVDFLTFLVGAPPVSVVAHGLPDAGRYREDNIVLTFTFPDGSLGAVSYLANGDKAFPKERVEVFAGGRVAVLDDYRSLEMIADGKREVVRSRLRQDKGHRAEWQAFAATIASGGPPPIPYTHLFGVTQATFAAVEALRSGAKIAIDTTVSRCYDDTNQ